MKLSGMKPRVSLGSVGWILLLGFLGYRIAPQVKAAFGAGAGDSVAPSYAAQTLDGEPISLEGLRGKVVLVNFWATWCPPCRFEMPGFQRVYEDKKEDGFVVLGVSTDRAGESAVREFLTEHGITYPVTMATGRVVQSFGGVSAYPTSFLIDREGRIRQEVKGIFAEPTLRMAVDHLLEEDASTTRRTGGER
ncbi:MAG TPA: TlpA disulfide reductase family protein [Longimicrobiaceae bacterium]|nr:TlpA disulfide reductase family protein [Longimicrobiaceae bacterium]